ncbi:hypothetical protein L5515_014904 [Caenorhabditis briggsae]|uniref:Uncharacterized protein n=1 Tax=Caenorhabditis briggsae TaxID=6238 RepID=A0AAE9J7H2_CAEBR|nr:hypothetical protein L5515_014904 [Caenorhabditis briggsae]
MSVPIAASVVTSPENKEWQAYCRKIRNDLKNEQSSCLSLNKYMNSSRLPDSRVKSPLYNGDSGIDSNLSSSSIGTLNSEKENLRFEDIILSSSDDEDVQKPCTPFSSN